MSPMRARPPADGAVPQLATPTRQRSVASRLHTRCTHTHGPHGSRAQALHSGRRTRKGEKARNKGAARELFSCERAREPSAATNCSKMAALVVGWLAPRPRSLCGNKLALVQRSPVCANETRSTNPTPASRLIQPG